MLSTQKKYKIKNKMDAELRRYCRDSNINIKFLDITVSNDDFVCLNWQAAIAARHNLKSNDEQLPISKFSVEQINFIMYYNYLFDDDIIKLQPDHFTCRLSFLLSPLRAKTNKIKLIGIKEDFKTIIYLKNDLTYHQMPIEKFKEFLISYYQKT